MRGWEREKDHYLVGMKWWERQKGPYTMKGWEGRNSKSILRRRYSIRWLKTVWEKNDFQSVCGIYTYTSIWYGKN